MLRIIIAFIMMLCLFFGMLQSSNASDLCCIGKAEKDIKGVCVVTGFQEGRICMEDMDDGKSKACRGLSGCYQFKDLGSAEAGDRVIVTGWRAGDQKCYNGPNCGKVIVVGGGASKQSGAASSAPVPAAPQRTSQESAALPPPPGSQPPVKDSDSLPPPPLPEGVQGQQQGATTASPPPPPQQPQPQAQPPAQQEPQQPATQTIDNTLDIFKKVKDLFK
jgi:hypothetical protein